MSVLKAPSIMIDFKFSNLKDPSPLWPSGFLHLAPLFRPCKQCWHVRTTIIFYIKNGYCHAPIWWPCDQWTVQTPSLLVGVREPCCTVLGAVGCFFPNIQGAWVGGLASAMVCTPMNCAVFIACVGLWISVWWIEWAPIVLEKQASYKTGHKPMWYQCFRGRLARVQVARDETQIVQYSPKKLLWSGNLNMVA